MFESKSRLGADGFARVASRAVFRPTRVFEHFGKIVILIPVLRLFFLEE
jgi:hypothetical protein